MKIIGSISDLKIRIQKNKHNKKDNIRMTLRKVYILKLEFNKNEVYNAYVKPEKHNMEDTWT